MVVALVAMPVLVRQLGADRLGVLSIVWMLIGYFSIFDFGLGRALTKLISERVATGRAAEVPSLTYTGLLFMTAAGSLGGALLALSGKWLVADLLHIQSELHEEALVSLLLVAPCLPFVVTTAGLRGVLEGYQRFKSVNIIKVVSGCATFGFPAIISVFSSSLPLIVSALFASRVLSWMLHVLLVVNDARLRGFQRSGVRSTHLKELIGFGGWMTAANLLAPALTYADRFVIGVYMPVSYVAYYATPYDMAARLMIFPGAVAGALLPALSGLSREGMDAQYKKVLSYLQLLMFPFCAILFAFADKVLLVWLGPSFASAGADVLRVIAFGFYINSFAQVAAIRLQAEGRPDLLVKTTVAQVPIFIALLVLVVPRWGLVGAALVWLMRVVLDTALLLAFSFRGNYRMLPNTSAFVFGFSVLSFAWLVIDMHPAWKIILVVLTVSTNVAIAVRWVISSTDRTYLIAVLKSIFEVRHAQR